jgi:hypothetical protein
MEYDQVHEAVSVGDETLPVTVRVAERHLDNDADCDTNCDGVRVTVSVLDPVCEYVRSDEALLERTTEFDWLMLDGVALAPPVAEAVRPSQDGESDCEWDWVHEGELLLERLLSCADWLADRECDLGTADCESLVEPVRRKV